MKKQLRSYRNLIHGDRLITFQVTVKETDLMVCASTSLESLTRERILTYRTVSYTHLTLPTNREV